MKYTRATGRTVLKQISFDKISKVMLKMHRGWMICQMNIRVKKFYKQLICYIYKQFPILLCINCHRNMKGTRSLN